ASATCIRSVDLPTPGSPPTRITEPGTMPPPSTRSHSCNGVVRRGRSCSSISASWRVASGGLEGSAPRDGASKVCSSVFHCSQLGHCPDQRAKRAPQAWHSKDERLLAMLHLYRFKNSSTVSPACPNDRDNCALR